MQGKVALEAHFAHDGTAQARAGFSPEGDGPFESIDHASIRFDATAISENDRYRIGPGNARSLFDLG
jgi:hypothetical protein